MFFREIVCRTLFGLMPVQRLKHAMKAA